MAYNARRAFEQYQQLSQQIAAFNGEIADARRAYFMASPAERRAAGDRFGELLFQKDLLIAMPAVLAGSGDQAKGIAAITKLANGGNLPDGGIAPSARRAFGQWVSWLQLSSGSAFGGMADPAKAAQAMLQGGSLRSYEDYRRLRDQAEFDDYDASRNGGAHRLFEQLSIPASFVIGSSYAIGLDSRVKALDNKILHCTYAGMGPDYYYWQDQPPADIYQILAMNFTAQNGALSHLEDHAASDCPADSKLAAALAMAPLKEPLTQQMVREGRKWARTAPRPPEQIKQMEDAHAAWAERTDAFRACNDEMVAALQAARLMRDRTGQQMARERNAACLAEVRAKYSR